MFGGGPQSQQQPSAYGSLLQAATYGMAIPNIYGMIKSRLLMIWAGNFRGNGNKGKGGFLGIGGASIKKYTENVDFLLGANPIIGVAQMWDNTTLLPLNLERQDFGPFVVRGINTVTVSDAQFYSVIGVTADVSYDVTFNDYGNPNGSQHLTGTMEMPLWNSAFNGPDPCNPSAPFHWPFYYRWSPSDGTTIYLEGQDDSGGYGLTSFAGWGLPVGVIHVYYYQKSAAIGRLTPLAYQKMSFESQLGSGTEYSNAGLSSQQIIYAQYAGIESSNIDMGITGLIDDLRAEVQGQMSTYATGDADYADMIEDIIKSAQVEWAALNTAIPPSALNRGLACVNYPGIIQYKFSNDPVEFYYSPPQFDQPNTAGNFLVTLVFYSTAPGPPTVSDTAGNTWTQLFNVQLRPGGGNIWCAAWYCQAVSYAGRNSVAIAGTVNPYHNVHMIAEIAGVDAIDATSVSSGSSGEITGQLTTTNVSGLPSVVLALAVSDRLNGLGDDAMGWQRKDAGIGFITANDAPSAAIYQAPVSYAPRTQKFTLGYTDVINADWILGMIAFKCTTPPAYPRMLPDIIDRQTLAVARAGARAAGLYGSLTTDSQQKASDYLKNLFSSMNAWPLWSGFILKSIAMSETSGVGNGAIFTAPTASGPVYDLSTLNGDFLGDDKTPPITVSRKAQVDSQPILQYQIQDRASNYDTEYVSWPDAGSVALYGPRKADPEVHNEIMDPAVALSLLGVQTRRSVLLPNTLKFKLGAKFSLLEATDLVTLTDPQAGINKVPARLTSVEEDKDSNLDCEAEPFVYGCNTPTTEIATGITQNPAPIVTTPASVNAPVIFEPVARLASPVSGVAIWIAVSDSDPNYGGCLVYMSTDGGASYNPIGQINGNATTGVLVSNWPAAADPDTTNDLLLDLTESLGALDSYQTSDEDNFLYPCYVAGGTADIPYELMTYAVATLTSAYHYTLKATGAGNELRRAVFGAPTVGYGVLHNSGSRFAFIGQGNQNTPGMFALNIDPTFIGTTLHFKFLAFNQFGSGAQDITDPSVVDYTYTPTGIPGSQPTPGANSYTESPFVCLSQPSGTQIDMAQTTVNFAGNSVNYNARTFAITNPSVPTIYYVTIADPGQVGDTGALTNLVATCQTSDALVGVPGNTFMGFIQAVPGGGASAIAAPGGWPQPTSGVVVP